MGHTTLEVYETPVGHTTLEVYEIHAGHTTLEVYEIHAGYTTLEVPITTSQGKHVMIDNNYGKICMTPTTGVMLSMQERTFARECGKK